MKRFLSNHANKQTKTFVHIKFILSANNFFSRYKYVIFDHKKVKQM